MSRKDFIRRIKVLKNPWLKNEEVSLIDLEDYPETISTRWSTGGAEGGNCWGGIASDYITDTREPEFELLEIILEEFSPELLYKDYKEIREKLIEYSEYTHKEWYGNHIYYKVKSVNVSDLWNYLKSKGYVK